MKQVTLTVDTTAVEQLGLLPERFFLHNESVEVLQSLRLAADELTLLVRVGRRTPGPTAEALERRREELRDRYGLRDFEVVQRDAAGMMYIVLLRRPLDDPLARLLHRLGVDVLPVQPFRIERPTSTVSFVATDAQRDAVRRLLDESGIAYAVAAVQPYRAADARARLPEKQRAALELALRLGYYDSPARVSLRRLAAILRVSRNAVSKRLRAAERQVIAEALGEGVASARLARRKAL